MGKTSIEWTQMTWNPVRGCSRVSEGCRHCYAERMAARFSGNGFDGMEAASIKYQPFATFAEMTPSGPRWTGKVELIESALDIPLRRKKPTTWFVNSMSDLFHEVLPDEAIDRVFAAMALCPQHTFQVLTKRAERMRKYFENIPFRQEMVGIRAEYVSGLDRFFGGSDETTGSADDLLPTWRLPLPNVWLGVSCENQSTADERIPLLLQTPAAVRFVSLEPLLGPIDLARACPCGYYCDEAVGHVDHPFEVYQGHATGGGLDWVIVGGESGPGARPMHPDWVRSIRDQCVAAGVPFFFKQFGVWAPVAEVGFGGRERCEQHTFSNGDGAGVQMIRVGKRAAGHLLDGQEWRQMPEATR